MTPCPICGRNHSTDTRMAGDVILCACGANLAVRWIDGGALLVPLNVPFVPNGGMPTMRVQYERLFNLGNYNNERISLEDDVQPGETPHEAYRRLRALVFEMADIRDPKAPRPAPPAQVEAEYDDGHDSF